MAILYVLLLVMVLALWILSAKVDLPPGIKEEGISRVFLKMSFYIYNKLFAKKKSREGERIRGYLSVLNNRRDIEQMETEYFVRKICIVLVMVTAGALLSMMLVIANKNESSFEEPNSIYRNGYGEGSYETGLIASTEGGEEIGEFNLTVDERNYTPEEADGLFEKASSEMEQVILGENTTLDEVRTDLNLPEKLAGYPFYINWRIDNYELIHYDGTLETDMIPEDGAIVNLTATYKYGDMTWVQQLTARLLKKSLSPQERMWAEINDQLKESAEESQYDEKMQLPSSYKGQSVKWEKKVDDNSLLILVLTVIGAAASYVLRDKELKKDMEKRQEQMLRDYPQLVSQLVLYLGAGMTVRNIFGKLSRDYLKSRDNGGEKRFVYEELVRTGRELASGASEAAAYERFGLRCGGQQYTKLSTLLAQNLRKGNSELLNVLNEEAEKAFNERMDKVRKLGEEAGTKLLLPMILMLVIVMIIIMIPAYMAF